MMRKIPTAIVALLLLFTIGCGGTFVRSELYFGLSRKAAPYVTPQQWQSFVDEVITPRFPNGLTIVQASGQWQMSDQSVAKEGTKIVIIVHPGTPDEQKKLDEIREAYKQRFSQEAVLEVDEDAAVKF